MFLLSITLFNSQAYHHFVIFPKEIYYKNLVLNQIKMDYAEILNKIDLILANKSANNDLISLDFLDSILSIDRQRINFISTSVEALNENKTFFSNFDSEYLLCLNHDLLDTFLELSFLINSISLIQA